MNIQFFSLDFSDDWFGAFLRFISPMYIKDGVLNINLAPLIILMIMTINGYNGMA